MPQMRAHRFHRDERGAVALTVGLLAPVLLGFAALSVDAGYWMSSQDALRTAASAAAISAMRGEQYGITDNATLQSIAAQNARAATSMTSQPSILTAINGATVASQAVQMATRYLSVMPNHDLAGNAGAGFAKTQTIKQSACLMAFSGSAADSIYVSGGAEITATNCGVFSDSSANSGGSDDAIVAEPSGKIIAQSVGAVGGIYASTSGGAYIGTAKGSTSSANAVTPNAPKLADPMASLGNPPPMPTIPTVADFPPDGPVTDVSNTGYSFGYNSGFSQAWGGCGSNYTAECYSNAGAFDGFTTDTNSFTFRTGSHTPNGSTLFTADGTISLGGNGAASMEKGTYYLSGPPGSTGTATGPALSTDIPDFTTANGTVMYANGGVTFSSNSKNTFTFGQGQYFFGSPAGGGYALNTNVENIDFTGGTYFFDGGLDLGGNGSVTFGPGIYYIYNGNLNLGGGAQITSNGATFVLLDGAGYNFQGGSKGMNLTAPTSNCVPASQYPESQYSGTFPYDGTNGEGICGILIYQARGDAAADTLSGSATNTIDGIIYSPSANLALSGNSSLSTSDPGSLNFTLGVLANTITATGSTEINLQASSTSPLANSTVTTYVPVLTQ